MARIDKVTQIVRATAGTALTGLLGVRQDGGGSIVPSGTATGEEPFGVVVLPGTIAAGDPVGVLVRGEVVEFAGGWAGSVIYAGDTGTLGNSSTNATVVGRTMEATRLIVLM